MRSLGRSGRIRNMGNTIRHRVSTHTVEVHDETVEYVVHRSSDWPTTSFVAEVTTDGDLYRRGDVLAELLVCAAESDLGLIEWVWVEPSARRRGVATGLYFLAGSFYDLEHDSLDNCSPEGVEWSNAVGGPRRASDDDDPGWH